jgi:exodeoxyribonuclease V alpha subunit
MARLLEAVRPDARLVLVGDSDQLASVEAGPVLADLLDGLSARDDVHVAALRTSHRFGELIGALADAIRVGDADHVLALLRSGDEHAQYLEIGVGDDLGAAVACGAGAACVSAARSCPAGRRRRRVVSAR